MSQQNDISGLSPTAYTELSTVQLPTRAEKRIIPSLYYVDDPLSPEDITFDDFSITAALQAYDQYAVVRIPGRGVDAQGNPDTSASAYFSWLINPSQVSISRTTLDEQAMSKGGWQIGVWGEDFVAISVRGKTPGKYFADGLTDLATENTISYRNLASLEAVVENNGYWFEGEQLNEGPLAADFLRRRIKMHQTLQLVIGEFIWEGCFESMTISESAESPFLAEFSLTFIAWREKFRNNTPYYNSIDHAVERGHVPKVALSTNNVPQVTPAANLNINAPSTIPKNLVNPTPPNINPNSPALLVAPPLPSLPPYFSTVEISNVDPGDLGS